jgi:hypothetical protein
MKIEGDQGVSQINQPTYECKEGLQSRGLRYARDA